MQLWQVKRKFLNLNFYSGDLVRIKQTQKFQQKTKIFVMVSGEWKRQRVNIIIAKIGGLLLALFTNLIVVHFHLTQCQLPSCQCNWTEPSDTSVQFDWLSEIMSLSTVFTDGGSNQKFNDQYIAYTVSS